MNAVNCSPSTFAKTMKRSAKPPLLIHIFSPLRTSCRRPASSARVLRRKRVGARAGFAQRVGADDLAGHQPRQVLLLLRRRCRTARAAGSSGWPGRRTSWRTTPTGRCARRPRATRPCRDRGRRTASGTAMPSRPELAAALESAARASCPVLVLEPLERRQHLGVDELVGRLRHQAVLVGELLRREDVGGRCLLEQPRAALARVGVGCQSS